jgi:molybdopterin-binding protein
MFYVKMAQCACFSMIEGVNMRLSARNKLKGKIVAVEEGLITAKVKIDLGNGNVITSIISREAVADLDLKVNDIAYAVIKSTEIMIGKD